MEVQAVRQCVSGKTSRSVDILFNSFFFFFLMVWGNVGTENSIKYCHRRDRDFDLKEFFFLALKGRNKKI